METADPRAARREQILETALRIADRDGFEGLTMRKLAAELGVSAPIVYRHFEDKASIIDALVAQLVVARRTHDDKELGWKDWLRATFCAMYHELTVHPGMIEILASSGPFTEHALRVTDEVLAVLERGGLDPKRSARAFRWLMGYTIGAVNMERGARNAMAPEKRDSVIETLKRYPRLFSAGAHLGGPLGEEGYQWCLERMLDVLERDLSS